MGDKIVIQDLRAYGIIGVYKQERETPQEILITVTLNVDTQRAAQSDTIADCVDYAVLAKKLKSHAESSARYTIEALANDLAEICLQEQNVEKVTLKVEKPGAIPSARSVGVEVERVRK